MLVKHINKQSRRDKDERKEGYGEGKDTRNNEGKDRGRGMRKGRIGKARGRGRESKERNRKGPGE